MKKVFVVLMSVMVLTGLVKAETSWAETRDDYDFELPTGETLSEDEKKVDEMLSEMKQEADQLYPSTIPYGIISWADDSPVHEGLHNFCMELPKGAELHTHDDKAIPYSRYIQVLKDYGKVYIVLEKGPKYGYLYANNVPDNAVPLNEALSDGTLTEEELQEILVITDEDIPYGRWVSLEHLFSTVLGLSADPDLMIRLYEECFRSCCENKVDLVELRVMLFGEDEINEKTLGTIREAYYHIKDEYPEFTVRIIGTSRKKLSYETELAIETLRSVIRLSSTIKDEYDPENPKDFIIGLDLVNEEDASKPLSEFAEFLGSDEVKDSGLKLFLHCGESLRLDNENVIDAYLLGASRVGHGFNLYRYPKLMEKYRENQIAIEVCPISNYTLGYVSDIRLHPGLIYLENDIPVVICSDDGLFMSRNPLTDDFYSVILSWDLGIAEIKELCRNSIQYAGVPEDETEVLMTKWESDWDEFIKSYVE